MNSNASARNYTNEAKENKLMVGNYCRRDNQYKTNRFYFELDTCEAFSYDWWQFVIKIGNTIYFNAARYSMQTGFHQAMAKNILFQEGLVPFCYPKIKPIFKHRIVFVYYKEGLNHLDRAINNMHEDIRSLREAIARPLSRAKTNKDRMGRISQLKSEIIKTKKLKKRIDKQLRLNDKIKGIRKTALLIKQMKLNRKREIAYQKEYRKQVDNITQDSVPTLRLVGDL